MDREISACFYEGGIECDVCSSSVVQVAKRPVAGIQSKAMVANKRDAAVVESGIQAKETGKGRIRYFLDKFRGSCSYCLATKGTQENHVIQSCPRLYGKCYRCLNLDGKGIHGSRDCPYPSNLVRGRCNRCLLPGREDLEVWHKDDEFGTSKCPNVFIREYALAKWDKLGGFWRVL